MSDQPRRRVAARFPAMDGLRAVGALAVLATHAGFRSGDALHGPFAGLLARMDAGVAIFFVISGFLLLRPHLVAHLDGRPRPEARPYLWHRALRILPVLWVAVVSTALLLPDARHDVADYLRHAFLVQIYREGSTVDGLTQMWSLATEVAFYLTLPALAWALTRGRSGPDWIRRVIAVCLAGALVGPAWMGVATHFDWPLARLWLPGFVGWFGAGMALAAWQVGRESGLLRRTWLDDVANAPGTVWAAAASLFVVAGTPVLGPLDLAAPTVGQAMAKNAVYAVIGALVVLPAVSRCGPGTPVAVQALGGRLGRYLGSISYGVFGYHVLLLALVDRWFGLTPFSGQFAVRFWATLAVSVLAATLSYYLMERPLMRWGRRRERGARPAGQAPAVPIPAATASVSADTTAS